MTTEEARLREYKVWSTYKVDGVAYVMARSAAEAVEKALDVTADEPVQFIFGEPHSETKMRARLARSARIRPAAPSEGSE